MHIVPSAKASEISFNEAILRLAAIHGRVVEFRYSKADDAPVEMRRFVPQDVAQASDNVIVLGDDEDRGEIRGFRLDRIKGDVRVPS